MNLTKYPLDANFSYPITIRTEKLPNPITVFPGLFDLGDLSFVAERPLTPDEITSIQDGKTRRLYVWGTVTYEDAFTAVHFTNFCLSFFNLTPKDVQFEPCPGHNDSN
jgi:hypothetical protein